MSIKLAFGVILFTLIFSAIAFSQSDSFTLNTPNDILISSNNDSFFVEITNNSPITKSLTVNFFAPTKTVISSPQTIAANSTTQVKISVTNPYNNYTEISSKLEVYLGSDFQSKEITVRFNPVNSQVQGNGGSANGFFGALFGLGSFVQETTNFSLFEWSVFWILVIIAAILLIAFVARLARRA